MVASSRFGQGRVGSSLQKEGKKGSGWWTENAKNAMEKETESRYQRNVPGEENEGIQRVQEAGQRG